MVLDAAEYLTITTRPECQAPVTEESKKRRSLYRERQIRDVAQKEFKGDYGAFLRDCGLQSIVRPMTDMNLERVHELTQRTNQMNFSGNCYTREQIQELLGSSRIGTYVIDCKDRFGAYGTIGFCTVDRRENRMIDLMLSLGLIRGVGLQEKWSRRDAGEVHRFALLCRHWALGKSDEFQGAT